MTAHRFFFDRCCPRRLARVITAFEETHTVRHYDDDSRFERDTPDVDWIRVLAADPPWVIVSMDRHMLTRPRERAALRESKLKFFLLGKGWMNMSPHSQAWRLLKTWPSIVEAAFNVRADVFEVSAGGSHKVEPDRT
jgi:hypothetical protein